ncbi:cytosolic sulfotransferase 17-like [Macadamia integrifolia]|uniref:cytosolic sulfotransferase 17-like n=1 Tax=Macadamia integrifolia TaxID=60698 RepID=UPI001C4F7C31|nr:cytosolic sulfotransferase 17-like [Macadamia integrifolia]
MPYNVLPTSIKDAECKFVYVTRSPKDAFVSLWHFANADRGPERRLPIVVEDVFESLCTNIYLVKWVCSNISLWKEHLKNPHKILLLKYEEMKSDSRGQLKRLASFLGKPFLNSLERLKNLEVKKNDNDRWSGIANNAFFRPGIVGDWKNVFTPEMIERLDEITSLKLEGSGLYLQENFIAASQYSLLATMILKVVGILYYP